MALVRAHMNLRKISVYPPDKTTSRVRSQFKVPLDETLRSLRDEVGRLGVEEFTLELDVAAHNCRQDGTPKTGAPTLSPLVCVRFEHPEQGPLSYPCDTYTESKANVRAVLLTLENLRAIDRYGAVRHGQQYAGFKALPSSTGTTMTREQAAAVIAIHSKHAVLDILNGSQLAVAIRRARVATHPDRGGDRIEYDRVEAAARILTEGAL